MILFRERLRTSAKRAEDKRNEMISFDSEDLSEQIISIALLTLRQTFGIISLVKEERPFLTFSGLVLVKRS